MRLEVYTTDGSWILKNEAAKPAYEEIMETIKRGQKWTGEIKTETDENNFMRFNTDNISCIFKKDWED